MFTTIGNDMEDLPMTNVKRGKCRLAMALADIILTFALLFASLTVVNAITVHQETESLSRTSNSHERRVVTFFKGWDGKTLLTTSGKIDTEGIVVYDLVGTKDNKKELKGHVFVELVYENNKLKKVIIRK